LHEVFHAFHVVAKVFRGHPGGVEEAVVNGVHGAPAAVRWDSGKGSASAPPKPFRKERRLMFIGVSYALMGWMKCQLE